MVVVDGDDILSEQGAVERVVACERRQKQGRGKKLEKWAREVEGGFEGKFEEREKKLVWGWITWG